MVPSMEWELFLLFGGQTDTNISIVPFVLYPKLIFLVVVCGTKIHSYKNYFHEKFSTLKSKKKTFHKFLQYIFHTMLLSN